MQAGEDVPRAQSPALANNAINDAGALCTARSFCVLRAASSLSCEAV
jgi:hypothetical protein